MNRSGSLSGIGLCGLAFFCVLLAFCEPDACQAAIWEALALCGRQLLPALFPFLIVSMLIVDTDSAALLGLPLRPLARLLGFRSKEAAGVLLIGWVGGFAPAAAAAARLYRRGELTAAQAARLLPACVCSGPSFVVLAVGSALNSQLLGWMLYFSQIGACLLCGLAIRLLARFSDKGRGIPADRPAALPQAPAGDAPAPASLYRAVTEATEAFLRLCGFVLFFRFLSGGLAALLPQPLALLPTLLLEVTAGCTAAAALGPYAVYWCCAVLSLQSGSVLMQVRAILPPEISLTPLLAARALHLPLSLLLLHGMLRSIPAQAVYSSLSPRVIPLLRCPPGAAFCLLAACCCLAVRLNRTLQPPAKTL